MAWVRVGTEGTGRGGSSPSSLPPVHGINKKINNTNITSFNSLNNPNLTCIQVDDIAFSNTNWTDIDPQSFFSDDCSQAVFFNIPDPNFEQVLIFFGSIFIIFGQIRVFLRLPVDQI